MIQTKKTYHQLILKDSAENTIVLKNVVIGLTLQNNIVETVLVGRAGTVKEYVSAQDWGLNLSIILNDFGNEEQTGSYPEPLLEALLPFLQQKEPLKVLSDFLKPYKIDFIIIKSFNIKQESHTNRQIVEVGAVSDSPYEMRQDLN